MDKSTLGQSNRAPPFLVPPSSLLPSVTHPPGRVINRNQGLAPLILTLVLTFAAWTIHNPSPPYTSSTTVHDG
jgi:hypothetical protein